MLDAPTAPATKSAPPKIQEDHHKPDGAADGRTMKAFVNGGVGKKALEDRPRPQIQSPGDAIVKMVKTTICGTDLHILKRDVATRAPGRILGHEGVGTIDRVGAGVTTFKNGDRVLISCISSCSKCEYCRRGMYSHCTTGGCILDNEIDGTQAEYSGIVSALFYEPNCNMVFGDAQAVLIKMIQAARGLENAAAA